MDKKARENSSIKYQKLNQKEYAQNILKKKKTQKQNSKWIEQKQLKTINT